MQAAGHSPIAVVDGVGALATMEHPRPYRRRLQSSQRAEWWGSRHNAAGEIRATNSGRRADRKHFNANPTRHRRTWLHSSRQAGGGGGTAAHRCASSRTATPRKPANHCESPLSATVFVVDDDAGLRETVGETLEAQGWLVETYASCEAFLAALDGRLGCLVIDAMLPGMDGFELLARLKADNIALPSIMITGHGDVSMAVKAMQAGACDFLEKPFRHDELISSIKLAQEKTQDSQPTVAAARGREAHLSSLTTRQRQILDLVLAGHPSKNIAADLRISQRTVENHRAAIMRKTGSRSIPALIRLVVGAV